MTSWQLFPPERTPRTPPMIPPVDTSVQPVWSVMIPVYNCGQYLEVTLRSVLTQAPPERQMQIEVVDDCSTDIDVQELVRRVGRGRISYFRQPCNVGNLRNFETCLNLSKGRYIHLLHGDDLIHDGFYRELGKLFETYPEVGAVCCRCQYIDEVGNVVYYPEVEAPVECVLENWLYRISTRQRIHFAGTCVKREVYETLGGFFGVHIGEEWEMSARIATRYPFGYTPAILASHRSHTQSISGEAITTAKNIVDLQFVMTRISDFLPEEKRKSALHEAKKFYSRHALHTANMLWRKFQNTKGAFAQLRKAWALHKDIDVALDSVRLLARMLFGR